MDDLLLKSITGKGVHLDQGEWDIVRSAFQLKKFRRGQYLLQQGDVARYADFIVKGLARMYYVDDRGQEHILFFAAEGWWITDLSSFYGGSVTHYTIDCLEPTEVLRITKTDLDRLYTDVSKMNVYFRILYQNAVIAYNKRVVSTLSKSALERYQEFIDRFPQVEQRIPNHQIASFLGITPQSLSRIRKQFAEKG